MSRSRNRRADGEGSSPVRSVRIDTDRWERAVRRATFEQTTISEVIGRFVEGYGRGLINAPKVQVVYEQPPDKLPARAPAEG